MGKYNETGKTFATKGLLYTHKYDKRKKEELYSKLKVSGRPSEIIAYALISFCFNLFVHQELRF